MLVDSAGVDPAVHVYDERIEEVWWMMFVTISMITCSFNRGTSNPISNAHGNEKGQSRGSVVRVDLVELDVIPLQSPE